MVRHASFLVLAGALAGRALAADPAMPSDWTTLAEETCLVAGRAITVSVQSHVDAASALVTWRHQACMTGQDMPSTCLSVMSVPEAIRPGTTESGRSFLIRCSPEARVAWALGTRWNTDGLDLEATRMDLRALTTAQLRQGDDGQPEVVVDPALPLTPFEPVRWSAHDPQPKHACVPLSLDASATPDGFELTVTPAATSCTGWQVRHSEASGGFTRAEPLSGYASPDLRAALAPLAGPLTVSPGRKLVSLPVPEPPPRTRSCGSSFSRR